MTHLDRTAIPGNVLDRLEEVERRLDDLVGYAAMPTIDPESGEGETTYVEILKDIQEGPDIVVTASGTDVAVGRAGDTILLFDSGGDPLREYAFTDAGLASALAAMAAGDVCVLPAGTVTGGPWTVPAGRKLMGISNEDSILAGTVTNNGFIYNLHINGNLVNNGTALLLVVTVVSGTGVLCNSGGLIRQSNVVTGGSTVYGIHVNGGRAYFCAVGGSAVAGWGLYSNHADSEVTHSRFRGKGGGLVNSATFINNCLFRGESGYDGLHHASGTAIFSQCYANSEGGGRFGVNLSGAGATLSDCSWNSISGIDNLIYGQGDRGAYSVEDHHAADIETAALKRHLPAPASPGNYARDDGAKWVAQGGLPLVDLNSFARGYFIRGGVGNWEAYDASGDGFVLIGDGTDVESRVLVAADISDLSEGALLFSQVADVTVTNTTDETSILGAGRGAKTIPANTPDIGTIIRLTLSGYFSTTGTPTLNVKVKLGGAEVCNTGVVTLLSGIDELGWSLVVDIAFRTTGDPGTVVASGIFEYNDDSAHRMVKTSTTNIDTTAGLLVEVTKTWGAAAAGNRSTCQMATIELVKANNLAVAAPSGLTAVEV